jgi:segregation and condensation protein B
MRDVIEALLFASEVPVRVRTLADVLGRGVSGKDVRAVIAEMNADYDERGASFSIEDIAGGVQLLTRSEFDGYVKKLIKARQKGRLSRAALETLAIIAYRQPLTRPEMEAVRGVDCGGVTQTLLERGLVKIAGRSESIGRPLLYATTPNFLEHFGLRSINQLPAIDELVAQLDKVAVANDMARELGGEPEEFETEIEARLEESERDAHDDGAASDDDAGDDAMDDETDGVEPAEATAESAVEDEPSPETAADDGGADDSGERFETAGESLEVAPT